MGFVSSYLWNDGMLVQDDLYPSIDVGVMVRPGPSIVYIPLITTFSLQSLDHLLTYMNAFFPNASTPLAVHNSCHIT